MTKTEIDAKIAEVKAQGEALQQEIHQLTQRLESDQLNLAKICGKIELLNELLDEQKEAK